MNNTQTRQATLCLLVKDHKILLAMKKRGFGKDKWNGVGGKLNSGETIEQAMIRETQEEIGVSPVDYHLVAKISFYFPKDKEEWNQVVHVFIASKWQGEPKESEEMRPQWFDNNQIPYHQMWQDDPYWMPQVLNGKTINAEFHFDSNETFTDYKVVEVEI